VSTTSQREPIRAPARRKLAAQPSTVVYKRCVAVGAQAFKNISGLANRPTCLVRTSGSNGWFPSEILEAFGVPQAKMLRQLKCNTSISAIGRIVAPPRGQQKYHTPGKQPQGSKVLAVP
jgi:hypothetical protein